MTESRKILFISAAPLRPANTGYKNSVLGRIHESHAAGDKPTVLALGVETPKKDPELEVDFFRRNPDVKYEEIIDRSKNQLSVGIVNLISPIPRLARIFATLEFRRGVAETIRKINPDQIIAESIWTLGAIEPAEWSRVKLVIHDVTTDLLMASVKGERSFLRKLAAALDLWKCPAYEREIFRNFRGKAVFLTREDMSHYLNKNLIEADRAELARNRLFVETVVRNINLSSPYMLFPGSVAFHQNLSAMKWMAKKVWPLLPEDVRRSFRVVVTGAAPLQLRAQLNRTGMPLLWTGEVGRSELNGLYAACVCVISPIISGTGLKIKNLETVAKGIPLVATQLSARGLDAHSCFKANDDTPAGFAEALASCIEAQLSEFNVQ